jgi:hypothetical protein
MEAIMASKKVFILAGLAACLVLSSCATAADQALSGILTDQEKADILVAKGLSIYATDIVANGDIDALAVARRCFETALLYDPDNAKALKSIDDLKNYTLKKKNSYVATAASLLKKDNRSDAQNYNLLLSVKNAETLQGADPDVRKLTKDTEPLKQAFLDKRNAELTDLAAKITAEKSLEKMQKNLKRADVVTDEIFAVDPGNSIATKSAVSIEKHVETLVSEDMTTAKTKLSQKKYAEAEAALLRADRSLAMATNKPVPEIIELKYQLYFGWGSSLFDAKKYQSADDKASLALKAKKTAVATTLKANIAKAASARDYDAEIDDIVESIDSRIANGDPVGALQIIQTNAGRLKVKANLAKLDAKKTSVFALRDQIYKEGIALYSEEDYDSAKEKFSVVVALDPAYEQAQSYLDKTNTKIKALSGGN